MRLKSFHIIRYLLCLAFVFYLGLYSAIVMQDFTYQCNCANQTKVVLYSNTNVKEKTSVIEKGKPRSKRLTNLLLVIVLTGPKNVERRNTMRSTWLNLTSLNVSVLYHHVSRLFVVGTAGLEDQTKESLENEQNVHKDMLLLRDFKDGYNQLTQKLMLALLWVSKNVEYSFLMKVDDDSFARLDVIISELNRKYITTDNLYWGFHRGNARVKYSGPWEEKKWLLCDYYLPYALGGGYIISMKLVHYIANISSLVVFYNSEDVSLGTWLSPLKLTRVHDTRFDTEWTSRGCRNLHIVSHKQSVQDMFDKYSELQHHNKLCKNEEFLRKSFLYYWDVPPSQCCVRRDGIP